MTTFWLSAFDAYVPNDSRPVAQHFQFVRSLGRGGATIPLTQRMQVFPDSGYVTFRSAFAGSYQSQTHVFFNIAAPAHAHAHLDGLRVHVYGPAPSSATGKGLPLLFDSGWFSYGSNERHYFESTGAHNTVTVDGLNQCSFEPTGKRADPIELRPLANCASLADGYPEARRTRRGGRCKM